jgi:hypothetical protein
LINSLKSQLISSPLLGELGHSCQPNKSEKGLTVRINKGKLILILQFSKLILIGGVEKVRFYPQTPQGGLYNLLEFNKSPWGI